MRRRTGLRFRSHNLDGMARNRWRGLRSLRARVAMSVFFTVVAIATVLTTIGFALASRWTASDMKSQSIAHASDYLHIVESWPDDTVGITDLLRSTHRDSHFAFVVDDQWLGDPRSEFGPRIDRFVSSLDTRETAFVADWALPSGRFAMVSIPSSDGRGRLFALLDNSSWQRRIAQTRLTLVVSGLIMSFGGLVGGALAGRRVSRPLSDAAQAARAVAAGGLSTRLPVTNDPTLADLTDTFNDMVTTLAGRLEMDRRFNSDVSHELRTPLTTLTASLAVLQSRRGELSQANRAALDLLSADLQRFARLVDDLLEISRIDGGVVSLTLTRVNVVEFLDEAIRSTRRESISLVTAPLLRIFEMEIDKRRIARVLANLIDNAFAHGAEPVVVTAVEIPPGDLSPTHVRITVEDHGEGVDLEHADQLFERFNRGNRQTSSDGSGLGLALAREHVRFHGGSIRFEPPQRGPGGTRISIFLPLARQDHAGTERIP